MVVLLGHLLLDRGTATLLRRDQLEVLDVDVIEESVQQPHAVLSVPRLLSEAIDLVHKLVDPSEVDRVRVAAFLHGLDSDIPHHVKRRHGSVLLPVETSRQPDVHEFELGSFVEVQRF